MARPLLIEFSAALYQAISLPLGDRLEKNWLHGVQANKQFYLAA